MVYEFREKVYSEKEHADSVYTMLHSYEAQAQESQTSAQLPLRVHLVNRVFLSPSPPHHFKHHLNRPLHPDPSIRLLYIHRRMALWIFLE